jgi:pimeloyl-ACP methyl ester carboxylesterase
MPKQLAVAFVHGIGSQLPNFADEMAADIVKRFADHAKISRAAAAEALVFQPVYWAPVLAQKERDLWKKFTDAGGLDYLDLRRFMVNFAADAIAYQPMPGEANVYADVHACFADSLANLVKRAGPDLPLVVIAHSLGTVVASNYFYDLQESPKRASQRRPDLVPGKVRERIGDTPLERGETLAWLFTMGSPIALWSLRYDKPEFGVPIQVPAAAFARSRPGLRCGWINIFDEDDVIGYPLQPLYPGAILEDKRVNAGNLLTSWNPLSHDAYWTDSDVTEKIAGEIAAFWKGM